MYVMCLLLFVAIIGNGTLNIGEHKLTRELGCRDTYPLGCSEIYEGGDGVVRISPLASVYSFRRTFANPCNPVRKGRFADFVGGSVSQ